jgi:Sec-independent protein translocase protein TatA
MFDIGCSELLIAGVVALVAVALTELPALLRFAGKVRRAACDFRDQFRDAMLPPRS